MNTHRALGASHVAQWPMEEMQEMQIGSLSWEDALEGKMATTLEFLPGKPHGQRSLAGYSPWDCKESDTTEPTL